MIVFYSRRLVASFPKTYYNKKTELDNKTYGQLKFADHAGITTPSGLQVVFCHAICIIFLIFKNLIWVIIGSLALFQLHCLMLHIFYSLMVLLTISRGLYQRVSGTYRIYGGSTFSLIFLEVVGLMMI